MLNLKDIHLKDNMLFVEEHPVVVDETENGVALPPETIARMKASRRYRTGVVLNSGRLTSEDFTKRVERQDGGIKTVQYIPLNSLIGDTVIYTADAVDSVVDMPIEGTSRLIMIKADYLVGLLDE